MSHQRQYQEIGRGTCGSVFTVAGAEDRVIKVPLSPHITPKLRNEFLTHREILEAFKQAPVEISNDVNVPKLHAWITPIDREFWAECRANAFEIRQGYCLMSQRIDPVPQPFIEAIVRRFAPRLANPTEILSEPSNEKKGLIRIYMGKSMSLVERKKAKKFSLQNFTLHVNEMEVLDLSPRRYSRILADSLAMLHWGAKVDADKVKFVLGSRAAIRNTPRTIPRVTFMDNEIRLWLLDFNDCRQITLDAEGVELMVRAFWNNDPYYPTPCSVEAEDVELWDHFSQRYLQTSKRILKVDEYHHLVDLFVSRVEEVGKKLML